MRKKLYHILAISLCLSYSKESFASSDFSAMSLEDLLNIEVTSASQQKEPIKETPVPITVITSDMIQNLGAKNLKDLLITYVPGITYAQDHNEINIAMRGIYASSQQKILIMLDGHRLNSRAYSESNPDFSISLEKIKQIEILRGPASSLYGNVALTAVINIITKSGKDIDGFNVNAGTGSYNQKKLGFTYGKEFDNQHDLVMWGNYYESDGQKIDISKDKDYSDKPQDGYALLDAVKNRPAYDLGLKYKFGDLSILANATNSHYIAPFSDGGDTGENYKYDEYRVFGGVGSGITSQKSHLELKYQKDLSELSSFNVTLYNDYNDIKASLITDPSIKGLGFINWNEYSLGGIAQASQKYDFLGKGDLLAGVQIDHMNLYDSSFPAGKNGDYDSFKDTKDKRLLDLGTETIYSGFSQLKHRVFDDKLIFNLGARYDEKVRKEGENVRALSPRLAVIWLPSDIFELKTSYSSSFVDAPYWYRYNSLPTYSGSRNLKPEHLSSIQLTPTFKFFQGSLINTTNFFYNDLYDFIYRDPKAGANDPKYRNAGSLKSLGAENEFAYIQEAYKIRLNATYQQVLSAKDYPITGSEINNVPSFTSNFIFDFKPLKGIYDNFDLNFNARYLSSQASPLINVNKGSEKINNLSNRVDQALILNAGFRVTEPWFNKLTLDGRVYNLLDSQYLQGGSTPFPYPQTGRWFLFNLNYNF